jgi:hypothetical protein
MKPRPLTVAAIALLSTAGGISPAAASGALLAYRGRANSELYSLDLQSGIGTLIGQTSIFVGGGMAASQEEGTLWAISGDELFTLDRTTGASTLVTDFDGALSGEGLAYDAVAGLLYASDRSTGSIYSISPDSGEATLIGSPGSTSDGLAFDSARGVLYGVIEDALVTIDTATGIATTVGPLGVSVPGSSGLTYDFDLDLLYLASRSLSDLYRVDRQTGAATAIGPIGVSAIHGLAYVAEPLPVRLPDLGISRLPDDLIGLSWIADAAQTYTILFSTDVSLPLEEWQVIGFVDRRSGPVKRAFAIDSERGYFLLRVSR